MKNKKKILFLSPLPPPYYGSALSSKMCYDILKDSKKFEVKSIKLNYSETIGDIGKVNLKKIKGIFIVKEEIKKFLKEFKPDIVYFMPATYSFGLLRAWIFVREIKKYYKKPILFHIRARILEKTWKNPIEKKFLHDIYHGNKAIVLGKNLVSDLKEIISKEKIFILPNAIKNEVSNNELKDIIKERKKNKQFNILFLSNMVESKGWKKVLSACLILKNKGFNFKCDFVGEWLNKKDEKYFYDFVNKNELNERVFSHGKKLDNEKKEFLEKADILIFPTEYPLETFGRVIIEAMMYGIPVIASNRAAIPEIIEHKKTGFVLKQNSPEEIVKYISELQDKKLRERMGKEGRRRFLEKYELKNYKKKFIEILGKI